MPTMLNNAESASPPYRALYELCDGFLSAQEMLTGCEAVEPGSLPDPFGGLLVHSDHMTTRLGAFHGSPVELRVLRQERKRDQYNRLISLSPRGRTDIVEIGVVRIDLSKTGQAVRDEILEGRSPLGDILINHDVMRRIEPQWYYRFAADSIVASHFGGDPGAVYGRLGLIYCDERPAIRLLEVVRGRLS